MIQLLFDAGPKYEPKYRNHCTSNRQCKFKYQLNKLNIRIKLKNSQNGHFHKSERCLVELDCNGYQQLFLFCGSKLHHHSCCWSACQPYKCHRMLSILPWLICFTNEKHSYKLQGYSFHSLNKKKQLQRFSCYHLP